MLFKRCEKSGQDHLHPPAKGMWYADRITAHTFRDTTPVRQCHKESSKFEADRVIHRHSLFAQYLGPVLLKS